ncbi:hypothetical protein EO087_15995 [Dyella sp. M7H15-1]|uniref:type III secretion system chaperone n=1 Tax=Dyella sp. M7H15-1 TaxID=2501295 RepID=UPI00100507B1|nr:type III secretion system chaperone [Dyella sp. M7H15-1]QAU25306.1 hypothetical protein EO087_15995 [Dyella sp. M7H15-1]
MDANEVIKSMLADISQHYGVSLQLDRCSRCELIVDEVEMTIDAPIGSDLAIMTTIIANETTDFLSSETLLGILELNFVQKKTMGGCIALDPIYRRVLFTVSLDVSRIDYQYLFNAIRNFVVASCALKKEVHHLKSQCGTKRLAFSDVLTFV